MKNQKIMSTSLLNRRTLPIVIVVVAIIGFAALVMFRPKPATGVPVTSPSATTNGSASSTTSGDHPLVPSDAFMEGPLAAKVTVVEFLDYQCPTCASYNEVMKQLRVTYSSTVRFVVRQFPLTEIHQYAKGAAIAAVCAGRQGKYFAYSDALFTLQEQEKLARTDLIDLAKSQGLDESSFTTCLDDKTAEQMVIRDRLDGEALGIFGTPTIYVNGKELQGFPSVDDWKGIIEQASK